MTTLTNEEQSGYPQTLIYFMWPYQVHFMISSKVAAESLFNRIDKRLQPTCFLLGFGNTSGQLKWPICYEPEKMDFLADDMDKLGDAFKEINQADPYRNIEYSGMPAAEKEGRTFRRNFPKALKKVLDESSAFTEKVHFVGQAMDRNGFDVHVVLQLNKSINESYQFLHYKDPDDFLVKTLSFLDAVIDVYLEDRTYRLYPPDAGKERGPERDAEELLRAAAKQFCYTIAYAGHSHSFYQIFPACEAVSQLKYEGQENQGHLIVCRKDHPDLLMTVEFEIAFPITEYRKLRKMMELTNEEIGVITNSDKVIGLGWIKDTYTGEKEDVFHIFFNGLHEYAVFHQQQPLLMMSGGSPELVKSVIQADKFAMDAKRVFPQISGEQIGRLYDLALAAAGSLKGGMLVYAPDVATEAKRLSNQCIAIKPVRLEADALKTLMAIDGALLIDLDGNLHAKGAILDGLVGLEGDSSRGSRYNAALTYQEYQGKDKPTMVVVVSTDGMVDTIPDLKPAIRRSELRQFLKTLENINTPESFNDKTYYNTMDLLLNRVFYLSQEECDQMNRLNRSLQAFDRQNGTKTVWRNFPEVSPDPKMNDSYYIPE